MLDYSAKNNNILSSDPYEVSFLEIGCTCYSFPGFEKKDALKKPEPPVQESRPSLFGWNASPPP
jgi:hypothetical protein